MNSISAPYKTAQFTKQWMTLKWMNFRIVKEHDKCVVTLHMSVFNPEHTLHPPGHAVHMSRIGTTASCQCLIPSWICLNQPHAWTDICAHRLCCTALCFDDFIITISRHTHTNNDASLQTLISVVMWSHNLCHDPAGYCQHIICVTLTTCVNNPRCNIKSQCLLHDSVLPRQQMSPTPIPT